MSSADQKLDRLELEEIYACAQVRFDYSSSDETRRSPIVAAIVAIEDAPAFEIINAIRGEWFEPIYYPRGHGVWEFEDIAKAVAIRDALLALPVRRCPVVQLFFIDDPYRCVGNARGVRAYKDSSRRFRVQRRSVAKRYAQHADSGCGKCG